MQGTHALFTSLFISSIFFPAVAQDAPHECPPVSPVQQALSGKSRGVMSTGDCSPEKGEAKGLGLADAAREVQGKKLAQTKVSPEEAQKVLSSVQPTLRFASEDSGLPIRAEVRPRMISRADLVTEMQTRKTSDQESQRLQAEELTIKKFGYLPRDFSAKKFVEDMYAESVAGFYDPKTKMISLLNWVSPDSQLDVLAHELTHALQDQNFNLLSWERNSKQAASETPRFQVNADEATREPDARRAVLEGQAMIVLIDHQFSEREIPARLESLPGAASAMSQYMSMMPVPDTPAIHASPVFLRDALTFPYREGLLFEIELLGMGGKSMAFRKVFAQPPLNTHEIMQPDAYAQQENLRAPVIPDLSSVLADAYEVIDSGGLGELDIRSLIRQYDSSRLADSISKGWRGSAYLTVKHKGVPTASATTADVALIYVSSWSSELTARKFAEFYASTVSRRYEHVVSATPACEGSNCPLESFQFNTEEGLVNIERRPNNMVLVTESLDPGLAQKIATAALTSGTSSRSASTASDLSLRYAGSPLFTDLRAFWDQWFVLQAINLK
jgi:hypothetical protein